MTTYNQQLHHALEFTGVEEIESDLDRPSALRIAPEPGLESGRLEEPEPAWWEYLTTYGGNDSADAQTRLNLLGAEGWELVSVVPPHDGGGQTVLYLKRRRMA